MDARPKRGVYSLTGHRVCTGWGLINETRWPYNGRLWPPLRPSDHRDFDGLASYSRITGSIGVLLEPLQVTSSSSGRSRKPRGIRSGAAQPANTMTAQATFIMSLDCEGKWGMADSLRPYHEALSNKALVGAYEQLIEALVRKWHIFPRGWHNLALPLLAACGLLQATVADTIVETDPVDPIATAARVPIAELDPPLRGATLGNKTQGAFHRHTLPLHTARLPLAIHADVKRNRIVQNRRSSGARR
jgi:hypothetical protein